MHMIAIALARGEVAVAAGPVLAQGPGDGVTAHVAEATTAGGTDPHHTQSAEAVDLGPQHVRSPEVQYADQGRQFVAPGLQCAEQQVAPALDPGQYPAPGRVASPGLLPGLALALLFLRGKVGPGLPARGKAPHLMLTDLFLSLCPHLPQGFKPFYTPGHVFDLFLLLFLKSLGFHSLAWCLFQLYAQQIPKLYFFHHVHFNGSFYSDEKPIFLTFLCFNLLAFGQCADILVSIAAPVECVKMYSAVPKVDFDYNFSSHFQCKWRCLFNKMNLYTQ